MSPVENITKPECDKRHEETMVLLRKIHDRLFVDNGSTSFQTRLDRHDRIISTLSWVGSILGALSLATLFGVVITVIKGAIK